ncbi:MAG: hypothetical protein GTN62_02770 [Gemmatimonadales bacterium]|nr:hypothetical protein [Gemmatimonadales bacterium]NIN10694.1 hypothetical protein [Gemmatimonadales bacterium]NIN49022.1 hypothetical protein [Gemmatimonadales bacterium]NIP06486.1 hypothetical protein [Gemmatimonadales bacterium]NIQ98831.1 hypothetical protein [Gemmatimonadales bacterium]
MTRSEDLASFVKDALTRGVPRTEIESILLQSGWSKRQVNDALASFADVTFPIPVPKPRPYTDAREAFLYGLLFLALALSAYHLGMLIFGFIENAFPLTESEASLRESTRWPISVLVVALPVYFYVSRLVNRELRLDPSKRASKSRSQMTYFTLFVCASVVIGILAGLVYSFLGGELTIRFVLKSLTAAAIAAGIFGYYLRDLRIERAEAARSGP